MAGLNPTLRTIVRNLPSVAKSLGFSARVTSAYRSSKKQAQLYQRYLQGLQPYPVAPPGTSDHEKGLAIDVVSTNPPELVRLLTSVGLFWAGESDPVHFSLVTHHPQITAKLPGIVRTLVLNPDYSGALPQFLQLIGVLPKG